jgi:hypothetical protein
MLKTFTKSFEEGGEFRELPDAEYWLAREEHILSYLWLRKASVPRVNFKDNTNRKLILDNVGESLDVVFKRVIKEDSNSNIALQINKKLLYSINALEYIFDLGVLHLDIALRNLVTDDIYSDKVFLIDFSHSLIKGSRTQKPIPLVPTEELHHPLLLDALVSDWNKFLVYSGQQTLNPPYDFTVSKDFFERFWSDELQVQNLSASHSVMCHGIGNLLIEASKYDFLNQDHATTLKKMGNDLRNNSELESQIKLASTKKNLIEMIEFNSNKNSEKTIIPKFFSTESKVVHNIESDFVNTEVKPNGIQTNRYFEFGSFYKEILAWIITACQIWWVDLAVQISHSQIPESTLLLLFFVFFICATAIFFSYFNSKLFARKIRMCTLFLSICGEILVLVGIQTSHINISMVWLPVLITSAVTIQLYISTFKPN